MIVKNFQILIDTSDFMITGIYSGIHRVAESILVDLEKTTILPVSVYKNNLYLNSNLDKLLSRWSTNKSAPNSNLIKFLRFIQSAVDKCGSKFLSEKLIDIYTFIKVVLNRNLLKSKILIPQDISSVVILINPIHRKSQIKFWENFQINENHELIVLVHDLLPYFQPKLFPASRISTFLNYLKLVQKAKIIYFVSDQVRLEYLRYLAENYNSSTSQELKLINLTALAPKEKNEKISSELIDDFILMVSTFEPRKNHLLFLNSVCALWDRGYKFSVVLAGSSGWSNIDIWNKIREIKEKYSDCLHTFQNCSDQTLDYLYKKCLFTVYPSSYEGFGLPILESVNFGKYVICQRLPATSKTYASYLKLFDGTVQGLICEIENLLEDNQSITGSYTPQKILNPIFMLQESAQSLIERVVK